MKKKIIILPIILILFGAAVLTAYTFRFKFYEWQKEQIVAQLPTAVPAKEIKSTQEKPITPTSPAVAAEESPKEITPVALPSEINLAVPFTPQAPYAVWDDFHNDACEEASVLMVTRFLTGQPIADQADAEAALQAIKLYEDQTFGYDQDTSAAETAKILTDYYHFSGVETRYDITLDDMKNEVLSGHPVIIPANGRALHNPFYKQPGPIYHMLVIKGVTADGKFITNDPGTKRGADFVYGQSVLYNAINDWDSVNHQLSGRRAMIVVH